MRSSSACAKPVRTSTAYDRQQSDPKRACNYRNARAGNLILAYFGFNGDLCASVNFAVEDLYHVASGVTQEGTTRRRPAAARNDIWSMDFVADQLVDGRRFRALTVIDLFTRECLAIDVGQGLGGRDVVAALERLRFERGLPQRIYCDNGTEFVSAAMDLWAYTNGVILDFSRRGKPTDNAAIESFNGRFREECLNVHWFASLEDAQQKIDAFRWDYNEHHPHRALKGLSPSEYVRKAMTTAADSPS